MARPRDVDLFLAALVECGNRASNAGLQYRLKWSDEKYWKIHSNLYESGLIEKGRGYSGTVIIVPQTKTELSSNFSDMETNGDLSSLSPVAPTEAEPVVSEVDLYEPARKQLVSNWCARWSLDNAHVENIAKQGGRDTGGSWTRPDLALVALKTYEYLPDRIFEIHTFEIKPSYDVTVKGVFEALAHRQVATRAYVIFHTAGRDLADYPEASRIESLAARHGIGVYAAKAIGNFNEWAEIVPATRGNPDPDDVEVFIKRSLSDETKSRILKWLK